MKKFFAPEVVQTSNMDCGPAALKCLLEGFGIPVSYGRLREACQTGIDGTSIDTLEAVANQLGLEAEQVLLPLDHLFLRSAHALPAIVVVQLPSRLTHFVVVWRSHGPWVQVMDPAIGRRWTRRSDFSKEVFQHEMAVPVEAWQEFASSSEYQAALCERLQAAGLAKTHAAAALALANHEKPPEAIAALDAATRLVQSLVKAKGVAKSQARQLIARFCANPSLIPRRFWSVRNALPDDEGQPQMQMRGAVLVRVLSKRTCSSQNLSTPELAAALHEPPVRPAAALLSYAAKGGLGSFSLLLVALIAASVGVLFEALLFRGFFDVAASLGLAGQRLAAALAILLFSLFLLALDVPIFAAALRFGRQIENRLRLAFLEKLPHLSDRYFQSRLTSDMAERSHATNRLRNVAILVNLLLRNCLELVFTGLAIAFLQPSSAPFVFLTVAAGLLPAFAAQPLLAERDLRTRSHSAGLTRFYLDAMAGLATIRAHCAERNIRREHDQLLGEWAAAFLRLQRASVALEAVQLVAMFGLIAMLLLNTPLQGLAIGRALLLVYWALNLPALGQEIGALARQYPSYRNLTLRLLEPLGAPAEPDRACPPDLPSLALNPMAVEFCNFSAAASGHTLLKDISLAIEPGSHFAIVGPSGAGKSSLLGALLGWLPPAAGEIFIDHAPLDQDNLRAQTAWVDPSVHLWNRSLFSNLTYGSEASPHAVGPVIEAALLRELLEQLPEGLQTKLGEGGALVSGGEGQRVRLGRALLKSHVRLVLLDEPFRGLDRDKRHELLRRARHHWRDCTLLCVTHDVRETLDFDRVVVLEHGHIVEAGVPRELVLAQGRYAELLSAEDDVRSGLWSNRVWRRVRLQSGRIAHDSAVPTGIEEGRLAS